MKNDGLYEAIVAHRAKFYHVGGVRYDLDARDAIDFVPKGDLLVSYRSDYEQMQRSFIYGKSLGFDELVIRLEELRGRFRRL